MIEPSVSAVLSSKYAIRRFYFVMSSMTACAIAALILVNASVTPPAAREALSLVLATLAANLAAIMIIYSVWIWITPVEERNAEIAPVTRGEIQETAERLLRDTSEYWFLGRGGGYFRAVVLPRLDECARSKRQRIRVRVLCPDPAFGRNSLLYREMIRGLNEPATEKTLAVNVLATALDLAFKGSANPYLSAEFALSTKLPVVRFDISANGALLTRDQPQLPAIYCGAGNPFYETFRDAVDNDFQQAVAITIAPHPTVALHDINCAADLEGVFKGFPKVDDGTVRDALELLKKPSHRYS